MSASFDGKLLARPAGKAASAIARVHLDDATAAAKRLGHADDDEALHDFRVAIRRLRVTIRAYPILKEAVPRKQRRRLRKLARATNPGRDLEVQIAWFRDHAKQFTASQRAALRGLRARLRAQQRRERARAETELARRFQKLDHKLRRRLDTAESSGAESETPFRALAAATVSSQAIDLNNRLQRATSGDDSDAPADLHRARIAAKRLRYLLEPLEPELPSEAILLRRLKQLQDLLGEMNDAHVLYARLDREGGAAAAQQVLQRRLAELLATLRDKWLPPSGGGVAELQRDVDAATLRLLGATPHIPLPRSATAKGRRRRRRAVTV
jgi:CHAD domain-containing protein